MQFNYIVSHNLRTPITQILGLCNVLSFPNTSEQEKTKIIEYFKNTADKMDSLVKDLNAILSTKAALNERKELVYFKEILKSIMNTLENQITESQATININIQNGVESISIIKRYLESVMYNLLSNSLKYSSKKRKPHIIISITKSEDFIEISVADNGIGIDLNQNGKYLFGLYKRFNLDTEGKGLGLHMTKSQVEAMEGVISAKSELDKGTTFTIKFKVS